MTSPGDRRVARGILALLLLVFLVVGIPVALVVLGASPVPSSWPSWAQVQSSLTNPDVTGSFVVGIVRVVGWVAWATFVVPVVAELVSTVRGAVAPRLRGLGMQQRAAATLIGAVFSMAVASPALAVDTSSVVPMGPGVVASATVAPVGPLVPVGSPEGAPEGSPAYTVRPGDSLWRIAEATLGDGARFQEIADLNYGSPQLDGTALDTTHWLQPGWVLILPQGAVGVGEPASVPSTPEASAPGTHVVRPGESLSSIAEATWGDGARFPEILAASRGVVQPDGSTLTSPDLIRPGWILVIPGAGAPGASVPGLDGAEGAPQGPPSSPGRHAPPAPRVPPTASGAGTPAPDPGRDAPDEAEDVADPGIDLRTATGVGGMLAAGIMGLIGMRRIQARRSRRPGQRAPTPAPNTPGAAFESMARAVADPTGRDTVDRVLRALAARLRHAGTPTPALHAARFAPGRFVELYLDAPSELPRPWAGSSDRTVWRLDVEGPLDPPPGVDADVPAPYPTLVTIGQDHEAHVMLDLERLGCLDVRGGVDDGRSVLAALAVELGTSPWADDLQVTVVGALAELPGIVDTGRVRHVASLNAVMRELEARALDVEAALRQAGVASIGEGRAVGALLDAWTPEILLVGEQLGPMVRGALERLVARVPGVGVAAVTTGSEASQWALEIDPGNPGVGVVWPAGVEVGVQRLDTDEYREALSLLRPAPNAPGPSWARNLADVEEPRLVEIPVSVRVGLGGGEPTSIGFATDPDTDDSTVDAPTGTPPDDSTTVRRLGPLREASAVPDLLGIGPLDLGPLEPLDLDGYGGVLDDTAARDTPTGPDDRTVRRGEAVPAEDRAGIENTEPATVHSLRTPLVRVLGPVEIEVASGIAMPASHQRQATELIAYLAFRPGASGDDISAALWPTRPPNLATRRSAVSRARRWLGVDASGHEYLPRYWARDDGTPGREDGGYRLRGVDTDWHAFLDLVGDDVTVTPTERLLEALGLVRGPVFAKVPARKYVWSEYLWQEMTSGIVDVAHEVARRSLLAGDAATARGAARVGRLVDPVDERSWRDAIRAEWSEGRSQGVARLVAQLRDHLASLDLDADPDTEDLIAEVEDFLADRDGERGAS